MKTDNEVTAKFRFVFYSATLGEEGESSDLHGKLFVMEKVFCECDGRKTEVI